jgi:ATP-binding cassette, subfamily F, member 3
MLRIQNLIFDAWGRRFFDEATALLPDNAKVGLVGRNGIGKSTLFRLIRGELTPGEGDIIIPKGVRLGWVAQEHEATDQSLLEIVLAEDAERARLMKALETATPEAMADIYGRLDEIGADRAPAKAAEILAGLGFSAADVHRSLAEFSGGWRTRVALAAALFSEPDLLLLDEPSNYLDLEGVLWLQERLKKYPRGALIISHDRDLLDSATTHTLHLANAKLELYVGGYSAFERQYAEKARLAAASAAKIEARRAHLQSFVDRFRAKATKARQAQSRLKMIARLENVTPPVEDHVAPFLLPSPEKRLPPPLLRLENSATGYGDKRVLSGLNLRLDLDDRIGLLGVNGSGKSTFAKLIAGQLAVMSGDVHKDRRLKVAWFHQHQIEALDPRATPLDLIRTAMPAATEPERRSRLAQFGLTVEKANTTAAGLSGGERARLLLNLVAMDRPHLLILDEPTNHLDIDSRRALADALNDYEGAVLLITHDRLLMELTADRLWLVANGTVRPFEGDMDDYAALVLDRARPPTETAPAPVRPEPPKPARSPSKSGALRKLALAEEALARETEKLQKVREALSDSGLYMRDPHRWDRLQRDYEKFSAMVAKAEAAWMEAAEAAEAL